jgi:hypothetical protein
MPGIAYAVRASAPFGYTNAANYSANNYGRVVEGNANLSYGPWTDPEVQRVRHSRSSQFNRRRGRMNNLGRVAF